MIILGTDTDVGKSTLAMLWLASADDRCEYWKPVESGPSDSRALAELVPTAIVHPPAISLREPLAPPLAARLEGTKIPPAHVIASARPTARPGRQLVVETFGSPFSPLNETELQVDLIHALDMPSILVSSSKLGAVGRTLQCLCALKSLGLAPIAVVLMGAADAFAVERIRQFADNIAVYTLPPPEVWSPAGIREAAKNQELRQLVQCSAAGTAAAVQPGRPHHNEIITTSLVERDQAAVWHPYTPLRDADPPLVCVGAQDEFLLLADGRRLIDGISSWWTILHGHRFPPLLVALHEAMRRFDHVHFAGLTHAPAVELAELLLADMPWTGGRVFYSDNGSTAVEVALKMAYQFWCHHGQPGRRRFVGFEHGYHGDTFGAMAVSRDPVFFGRFELMLLQADILPLDPGRLDEHLTRLSGQIAGVILEPLVQGAGGMRMHAPETLRRIFEVTRAHDVLFLADEVMTGGGRTGNLWAHQEAGIAPDLVCAGKTLTGGVLPLAATLAAPRVVEAFDSADRTKTFFHGHSFTAHPLACAVAAANWRLLRNSATLLPQARELETFWRTAFAGLEGHPKVREVRIKGSIAALEVDCPGGYLAEIGRHMRQVCLEDGVLLRPLGSVLYAMPPLRTSQRSLRKIAAAMIRAVP